MKYGLVPSEVMSETYSSNNTSQMALQLKTILRQGGHSRELAAVTQRIREEPIHLPVIERKFSRVNDSLQEKVSLLELVIEEQIVL